MNLERRHQKLSQKDISYMINISRTTISRLEISDAALSFEYAVKIVKVLKINLEDITRD